MKLHANAALTPAQRAEVKRLFEAGQGVRPLADRFGVHPSTVQKWTHRDSPFDRSSAAHQPRTTVTPEYRQAVLDYRKEYPHHGPIRIARALKETFPQAHRGTVLPILQEARQTPQRSAEPPPQRPIPVGRHRVQMDVQKLPAVEGGRGFEFKITVLHLRTRWKYSEIHPDERSETLAGVLRRALDRLPPFGWSGPTMPSSSP